MTQEIKQRLEYLRGELRAERISLDEIVELQSLAPHIEPGDVELLEAAGVPEFPETPQEIELSDGGVIEAPDAVGTIRRRDVHGNTEDIRRVGEDDWQEWADLFGVQAEQYLGDTFNDEHGSSYDPYESRDSDGKTIS